MRATPLMLLFLHGEVPAANEGRGGGHMEGSVLQKLLNRKLTLTMLCESLLFKAACNSSAICPRLKRRRRGYCEGAL